MPSTRLSSTSPACHTSRTSPSTTSSSTGRSRSSCALHRNSSVSRSWGWIMMMCSAMLRRRKMVPPSWKTRALCSYRRRTIIGPTGSLVLGGGGITGYLPKSSSRRHLRARSIVRLCSSAAERGILCGAPRSMWMDDILREAYWAAVPRLY
ncbi:hypothetical protein C8R46DRAFT_1361262, partial [Mycena filopes]